MKTTKKIRRCFFRKQYFIIIALSGCLLQVCLGQETLTGLYRNEAIEKAYKQLPKYQHKSNTFIHYEPISLPFIDDFSNYTGYPDTALWIGRQAFVNQSFAVNPPTIGCVTLDAVDEKGRIYEHASRFAFSADTLLSRPIRLDSVFYPVPGKMSPADSVTFCFFYQPGGGTGSPWEGLGNAPEETDSLILEFGYQTGNIALLYYTTDSAIVQDSIYVGDTVYSHCDPNLFIIAEIAYSPGDKINLPCDSVTAMEVVWTSVWSVAGSDLKSFINRYGSYFRQIMIPLIDTNYFNRGFQFRFRNYASLEYDVNRLSEGHNVDFWNIDYVRLNRNILSKDTAIDDIAIVNNPGSILTNYTAMPWNQFKDHKSKEMRSSWSLKLTNLFNITKNTAYRYRILDHTGMEIGSKDGGNQNLDPFYQSGYQTFDRHANPAFPPDIDTIKWTSAIGDSLEITVQHIFKEEGSGDKNQKNDTAVFLQKFHNYFACDDGIPEAGYVIHTSQSPYNTALAMAFSLNKPDTLQAIDIYVNHTFNNVSDFDFTLTVWGDDGGKPGKELYSSLVEQSFSEKLYGFQRFYPSAPFPIAGTVYIGYQCTDGQQFLNIGFDQNNDNSRHVFYKVNNGQWSTSFLAGTPMLRLVTGKSFDHTSIRNYETVNWKATIYPNPTKEKLYIELPQGIISENITLSVYSVTGQKIRESRYVSELTLSDYAPGLYILRLTHDKEHYSSTYKFIISE